MILIELLTSKDKYLDMYSSITEIPDNIFIDAIMSSESRCDFLRKFNMTTRGAKFKTLNKRIKKMNLDISHFKHGGIVFREKYSLSKEDIMSKFLIYGSLITSDKLKKHLLKHEMLNNQCATCNNNGIWNNVPLVLELDHIDGDSQNNCLENLRLLCPNCHSQTHTFCRGKNKKQEIYCNECDDVITKQCKTGLCRKCRQKPIWHDEEYEALKNLLSSDLTMVQIGKKLNISDNAVRKRCIKYGINYKER